MIKSLEIKNFKSIKHQTIKFNDVNILIGANNSGKSNLLDSIFTIQNIFRNPIEDSFARGPFSFAATFCRGARFEEGMVFNIKGEINSCDFEYEVKLGSKQIKSGRSGYTKPFIQSEYLIYNTSRISHNSAEFSKNSMIYSSPQDVPLDPTNMLKYNFKSKRYQFVPAFIKKDHQIVDYELDYDYSHIPYLAHDGSNLLDVLYYIREYDSARFSEIIYECKKFFPNLKNLKVQTGAGDNSLLEVTMENRNTNWRFVGPQLSDGFAIILSIITLLSSKQLPNMILFEELENGLNPSSIEKLLDRMFEVARKQKVQILITTHSPVFLQLMRNSPESVIICEQDNDGLSHYISLRERLNMFKDDYQEGESLVDLWFSGLIGGL